MPPALKLALGPVLEQIAAMTLKIKQYDREIQRMTQTEYAETQPLLTIHGIGHITALTFVLTLGDKQHFRSSRDVGCYLGLRPRRSQSGERDPQLGITKAFVERDAIRKLFPVRLYPHLARSALLLAFVGSTAVPG
jgi:transposase